MVEGEQKWWDTPFFANFVLGICGTGGSGHGFHISAFKGYMGQSQGTSTYQKAPGQRILRIALFF